MRLQHVSHVYSIFSIRTHFNRTHTHPFNGPFSRTTRVGRYQKGKTNLDFTAARDSEWQWHQLGRVQVCTSLQTDNHASTPPLSFLQAGCPSCRPTNSVKALKAHFNRTYSILACAYPRTLLLMNTLSLTSRTIEGWWRGSVVERRSLAGELSLSCA